ncbi:aspartate aminotransferase family protein [Terasakiella sp. A23]|uniref:aspartate aminotransferase family protein n=1 Tax=Terasakiella sp. FCG-A23 TaxID=3080561 RepID=UPI0029538120|nr:aspartate aminotransferase family protein [Terasakiella sp. A23]MDV7340048.1 aspartate aminotransferase family protein [Terasakiella sp. A23]
MTTRPNNLDSYWMPFTANKQFKKDPRILVSADRMHYTSEDGRLIMDTSAGLWCVNAGHNRPKIREAVQAQVAELDYCPSFQFGHPKAFELANQIAEMFPEGMNHVFFTNSGSESVDSALKIALAYHRVNGEGTRTRLIGRERGYHGTGFGGITVGGLVKNRMYFGALLTGADHLPHTHNLIDNAFTKGCPDHGADLANELENIITLHDASNIACVIVEPMAGSTGVLIPPKGYLKRLREICTKHGILLIFDEVITAFGRLGTATASDYFDVKPDIITCAKGLTNGVIPMGAVVVADHIYNTMMEKADSPIELFHGYTYSGHPIAAACGLATLEIYREEGLFERAADLAPYWENSLHQLRDCKNVIDIRNIGLVGAIELEANAGKRGFDAMIDAYNRGLMIRVTGDIIALSPPLIIEKDEIDFMMQTLRDVLSAID